MLKYKYNGGTYGSLLDVFKAVKADRATVLKMPATEKEWTDLGVTCEAEDDDFRQIKAVNVLNKAKTERALKVSKSVVEVDGMRFDGDEQAQTRMGRTVAGAVALGLDLETEKRQWVLADNTVAEVTIKQLAQALEKAGNAQTELWVVPYQEA